MPTRARAAWLHRGAQTHSRGVMGGADDGTPGTGARPARHGHGSKEAAIRPGGQSRHRAMARPKITQANAQALRRTGAKAQAAAQAQAQALGKTHSHRPCPSLCHGRCESACVCLLPVPVPVSGLCSWVSLVLCLLPCGQLRVGGGKLGRGFCPPRRAKPQRSRFRGVAHRAA